MIDEEIRSVIDRNYYRAEKILQENMAILHLMADALMKWETIDRMQIDDLMAGKDPKPPVDTNDSTNKPDAPKQDTTINTPLTKPAGQV